MERREGWLGYVAVGLGALALLVALFGSGGSPTQVEISLPAGGYTQMPDVVPAVPPAPADAVPPIPPLPGNFTMPAMPPDFDRLPEAERQKLKALQDQMRTWRDQRFGGPFSIDKQDLWMSRSDTWGHGWGPPAFVPAVLKLVVAILAIGFGLRLLRGGKGGQGHTPAPPSPPSVA